MPQPDSAGRAGSALLIVLATGGVIAATLADGEVPLRAPISLLFIVICPGLAIVRLARLAGFVPQLVLSIAVSIALAGIVGTAQLYAGTWSPPTTFAILAAIATGALILDPWLFVPGWRSGPLRSVEGRLVPALLVVGASVAVIHALGAGIVIGEWRAGAIASAAGAVAGMAAFAGFVGSRSVAALYATAILLAVGLPGVVSGGTGAAVTTTAMAFAHAIAWAYVAFVRAARGGHVGWQLAVAGAFLALSASGAVVPDLTPGLVPALLIALAAGLIFRESRQDLPDAEAQPEPSALRGLSAHADPARIIRDADLQPFRRPESELDSPAMGAAPATAQLSDGTTPVRDKRRRPQTKREVPASDAPRDHAAGDAPEGDLAEHEPRGRDHKPRGRPGGRKRGGRTPAA